MIKKAISFILLLTTLGLAGCSTNKTSNNNIYTGTVESEDFNISSEVTGKINEITLSEGSLIKSGDKIVQVDSKSYEIQKQQAEAALKIAKAKESGIPDTAKASIKDEAQGAIDQAQASVDLAKLQIEKTSITSSIDGTITAILVHKGDLVTPGTNVAKVTDLKNKYIKIYIEESKRNKIKLNNSLIIKFNDKTEKGKITYISEQSEFTPKNVETKDDKEKTLFEVKLKLDDNSTATPGLIADVILE
ncbi:HlyD family efflux transporter periplasmic adaptor subunit [Clostridium sp. YIM B02505]|uniref:HlyD family efflux transporter periplasmic adaptor subunit n=1 Tax=Clostridium yunnanense TaxID=2800325 RepID=A0ABS1EVS4_9CLOT|nr:biotin/lipoyl-binding protein [Clostridium yunnanense]MBK1813489.1 HlyD family efflux transporter periplasmic adaptor subunit [Clostridium yunnanense]